MADYVLISLAFLHVATAIAWMGGVVFFLSVVGPGVRTLNPPGSLEFLTKVGPRLLRYFMGAATGTIIFGLALLVYAFGTDASFWPSSIEIGFGLGLVAYLIAMLVTVPTFRRANLMAQQIIANPAGGPPPPEFAALMRRANMAAVAVALILFLTLVFMVGTAF